MEDSQFGEAQRQIHDFLWGEFCDWYIEIAKIRLRPGDKETVSPLPVLVYVLETSLRLLHPFMPFITEELWQRLKRYLPEQQAESIMIAPYPEAEGIPTDPQAERVMESVIEIIRSIRNARAQYKVEQTKWVEAQIYGGKLTPAITPYSESIQALARAKPLSFLDSRQKGEPKENTLALVLKETEVVIPMESMVDVEAERKRLQQEIEQNEAAVARLEARLKDKAFLAKAPASVVEKERTKLGERKNKLERLKQQLIEYQT
jgi:valyl-tRNA synthetase